MSHLRETAPAAVDVVEESRPALPADRSALVPLGRGRELDVRADGDRATLVIHGQGRPLQIEIRFDASGPVLRVEAPRLDLQSVGDISVSCEAFNVHARERIDLRSGGDIRQAAGGDVRVDAHRVDVEASPGAIRLKANDEVQALGEMILLNCEHPRTDAPMPAWVQGPAVIPEKPAEPTSGEAGVIAELLDREPK